MFHDFVGQTLKKQISFHLPVWVLTLFNYSGNFKGLLPRCSITFGILFPFVEPKDPCRYDIPKNIGEKWWAVRRVGVILSMSSQNSAEKPCQQRGNKEIRNRSLTVDHYAWWHKLSTSWVWMWLLLLLPVWSQQQKIHLTNVAFLQWLNQSI